ncbi:MAG: ABC transporter permease [Dehalococcoidia bacterium]|nr:ABC transporter permease [Dehalococcoidia bacterium]
MTEDAIVDPWVTRVGAGKSKRRDRWSRHFLRSPIALVSLLCVVVALVLAFGADAIAPHDPLAQDVRNRLAAPSMDHPFGTDALGRDVLSRVIHGTQVSLTAAFSAVALSALVGVSLGIIAGYVGGLIDEVIMRIIDSVVAFPAIILALAFVTAFGATLRSVIFAITIVSIPLYARLMRAQIMSVKETDFVLAARAIGARPLRIMGRHMLPNVLAPIVVAATLGMSYAILAEASLSFLGAGVQPPTPTWGGMLNDAARYIHTNMYMTMFPGAAIFILVLSLNYLGDTLQDVMDPRSK